MEDAESIQAAAERLSRQFRDELNEQGHADLDRVEVNFDWEIPSIIDEPLTFMLAVTRGARTSSIYFNITLAKMEEGDLQRLHDLLAKRPKGYQLIFEIAWLLDLAIRLQQPDLSAEDRYIKIRALLLAQTGG